MARIDSFLRLVAEQGASETELLARALHRVLRGRAPAGDKERRRAFRALVAKGHRPSQVAGALGMAGTRGRGGFFHLPPR